jgi:hypothetical protein
LLQLPETSTPEQSNPTLQEAIADAKAQGFKANDLFAHLSEDCFLPCWNNIEVGESSEELVLERMGELEFNSGPYLFESEEYDKDWRFVNDIFIPAEGDPLPFSFATYANFNDDILQILELVWFGYGLIEMFPDVVIEQLGTPDEVYVAYDVDRGRVLWLKYERLQTDFIYLSFASIRTQPFEICTDATSWINAQSTLGVFISSSDYPEAKSLSIDSFVPSERHMFYNLTEVSLYTAESFAKAVVNDSETCLTLDEEFVSGIGR